VRKLLFQVTALLVAAGSMSACTATPGPGGPSSSTPAASTSATAGTSDPSGSPAPDTETSVPAPAPPSSPAPSGPGAGNAELSISVKPSEAEPALNYTLVCQNGAPAAESKHPAAEAACAALKNNAGLLSPSTKGTAQACTEQYGGPQQATVTGIVDETPVDVTFARTNGCEISAWNAAQEILGVAGGAA
jgi:hypothetical protein